MEQLNKRMPERRMKMARMKKAMIVFCVFAIMIGSSVYAYSNSKTVGVINENDFKGKEVLVSVETEVLPDGFVMVDETYEVLSE